MEVFENAEILTAEEKYERQFEVSTPIYTPFYNIWGKNVYWQTAAFEFSPVTVDCSSTSGSPVVIAGNLFIGFLNMVGGKVKFDGIRTLTVSLEVGQSVMICENCDVYAAWNAYNRRLSVSRHEEKFWERLEYCTWVEQSKTSYLSGLTNHEVINEAFVNRYLERVEAMGLPKGKFTIDDGWAVNHNADGGYSCGNWEIDRVKFPHFEKLIADINAAGYDVGLWFSPFTVTPDCELAQKHPELLGGYFSVGRKWQYLRPKEELLRPYYHELFSRYLSLGIRKLKLDISYGPKNDMIALLKLMDEEIKKIDRTVEIETHIPDIFAVRYADTVRLNDVSIAPDGLWRGVTLGHYEVCRRCAAGKILNFDHIGSNAYLPSAKEYMEHWHILRGFMNRSRGYPVISGLPDTYVASVRQTFVEEINSLYTQDGYRV